MPFKSAEELGPGAWELLPLNTEGQRLYLVFDSDTVGVEAARGFAMGLLSEPRPDSLAEAGVVAEHFLSCIRAMWQAGEVCLRDHRSGKLWFANTPCEATSLGWLNTANRTVYLEPAHVHGLLQHGRSEHRMELQVTRRALGRALKQTGLLVVGKTEQETLTVQAEGQWHHCWVFEAPTLFPGLTD